ncbi:MAG: DKNYY domain-containing protein [Chitinophagales bacterium]|nr:DKNYY domain-containing protein [Chitinophagales bacterium]
MKELYIVVIALHLFSCELIEDINMGYIKRDQKIYWSNGLGGGRGGSIHIDTLYEADYSSFQKMKGYYAKDKNHVYFRGCIVKEVDSASFEVKKEKNDNKIIYIGKDKHHFFINGILKQL